MAHSKVILLDLENNLPTAQLLHDILNHYAVIYMFNCKGQFEYPLDDLTQFATWVASGQIVILETPNAPQKEFEYAMLAGQLLALLLPQTHCDLISANKSSLILVEMLNEAHLICELIQLTNHVKKQKKNPIPNIETILNKPELRLVKRYCDILGEAKGQPSTKQALINSLINTLHVDTDQAQSLLALLINLKLVKCANDQIHFRKKVLKQWLQLDLEPQLNSSLHSIQTDLFKNFAVIDPIQVEIARTLRALKGEKPKDIYALRDLLFENFPNADIRSLLKELIEKGYIYWNGHEVLYSHELFLN